MSSIKWKSFQYSLKLLPFELSTLIPDINISGIFIFSDADLNAFISLFFITGSTL